MPQYGRTAWPSRRCPAEPLLLDQQSITLPAGANLDLDWHWLVTHCGHTSVLLVENWEAFDRIHQLTFDLSRAGDNPLVVFRGSPVYRQDHVMSLLRGLALPVFAFVDYDPSGLVIAHSLPHFAGLIAPPADKLETALAATKNHDRYRSQLPETQAALDAGATPGNYCALAIAAKPRESLAARVFLDGARCGGWVQPITLSA